MWRTGKSALSPVSQRSLEPIAKLAACSIRMMVWTTMLASIAVCALRDVRRCPWARRSLAFCVGGGRRRLVLGVLPGASRGVGLGTWGNAWLGPGYPLGPGWGRAWMVGENGANRPGPLVIGSRLFLLTGRWHVPWLVVFPEVAGHDFRVVGGAERGFCAVVHDIDEEQAAVGHLHFVPCMGTGEWF